MAKATKKVVKTKPVSSKPKSGITIKPTASSQEIVIRVEIVIKDERNTILPVLAGLEKSLAAPLGVSECPDDVFTYLFTVNNALPVYLQIGDYVNTAPGASGNFTKCVYDFPPKIDVLAYAQLLPPYDGYAQLQLTYRGRNVFAEPKELTRDGQSSSLKLELNGHPLP